MDVIRVKGKEAKNAKARPVHLVFLRGWAWWGGGSVYSLLFLL